MESFINQNETKITCEGPLSHCVLYALGEKEKGRVERERDSQRDR